MLDQKEIIKGCIDNDRRSQEVLYKHFFPAMMNMCRRYSSDPDTLLSIINDGFLKVFQNINKFEDRGSLEGWIRKIVFRSLSDHFKKENKYLKLMIFEERDSQMKSNALDELYFEDILELVGQLPTATQKVFRLYAIEGYTHPEVSDLLNISVGTSKWHLSEARKQLKSLIKKNSLLNKHAG